MARPRTEIGTFGTIKITQLKPDLFEARTRFRMRNGRVKRPRRRGKTGPAAERALKKAITKLANEVAGKKINSETRFGHVIDLWLADFEKKVERGERAPKSLYDYRDSAEHLRKEMGELTCGEAEDAGLCDEVLKGIRDATAKSKRSKKSSGYAAAKRAKTVLTGICAYALRHGAMETNPAKSVEALEQGKTEPIRALEPEDRADFLKKLRDWCAKRAAEPRVGVRGQAWTDLPDVVEGMLATGTRPGEVLAVIGPDVVPAERTAYIGHHLVRVEGQGIVRAKDRKGGGAPINPMYPSWAAPMFARRKMAAGEGPLFPTWNGQWQDPSNVMKRVREACDGIGYGWVSSRMFRHTVGTHLGDSGVSNEQIGDQLGNTPEVVQRHYRRRKITNEKVASALESMMDGETG